jgi:hypothetical protein
MFSPIVPPIPPQKPQQENHYPEIDDDGPMVGDEFPHGF